MTLSTALRLVFLVLLKTDKALGGKFLWSAGLFNNLVAIMECSDHKQGTGRKNPAVISPVHPFPNAAPLCDIQVFYAAWLGGGAVGQAYGQEIEVWRDK